MKRLKISNLRKNLYFWFQRNDSFLLMILIFILCKYIILE